MRKRIGLLLSAIMVISAFAPFTFGFTNPLKSYNLYDDVHGGGESANPERETAMDEFYANSMRPSEKQDSTEQNSSGKLPKLDKASLEAYKSGQSSGTANNSQRRNDNLRESSRHVYADPSGTPGWMEGPSFYQNPTLESIKTKYHRSNFAGCLQECISYVRKYQNDTLGYYYLAMSYAKVNDKENAIRAYEKVISLNSNPMIVKYATNGRNCVMGSKDEICYPNVNEPELLYPYKNLASNYDLTPVNPQTLVNRNLAALQNKLSPSINKDKDKDNNNNDNNKKDLNDSLNFFNQDSSLDKFINAPYGNGLSSEMNAKYTQTQLKRIQEGINSTGMDEKDTEYKNLQNIKNFDNKKSDLGTMKLAYAKNENVSPEGLD